MRNTSLLLGRYFGSGGSRLNLSNLTTLDTCHVKVRARAGGFNGITRLPLSRRNAPDLYRASPHWRFRDPHFSMP
jgi:hypothetical protein